MIYDTNGLSGWADGFSEVLEIVLRSPRIIVPVVALAEYRFGLKDSAKKARRELWLKQTRSLFEVPAITETTAEIYTDIAYTLKKKRPSAWAK